MRTRLMHYLDKWKTLLNFHIWTIICIVFGKSSLSIMMATWIELDRINTGVGLLGITKRNGWRESYSRYSLSKIYFCDCLLRWLEGRPKWRRRKRHMPMSSNRLVFTLVMTVQGSSLEMTGRDHCVRLSSRGRRQSAPRTFSLAGPPGKMNLSPGSGPQIAVFLLVAAWTVMAWLAGS